MIRMCWSSVSAVPAVMTPWWVSGSRVAWRLSSPAKLNAQAAVRSALADVKRAVPLAKLVEAAPDFVGLTDVAELVGVSRQAMRKVMLSHAATFPAPVHEGSASIWHLAEVLGWLEEKGGYAFERKMLETARAALEVNLTKEVHRLPVAAARELKLLIA